MIIKQQKYNYSDLEIVPEVLTGIRSRSACNAKCADGTLPIFTAPMDSVVDDKNYEVFEDNDVIPIIHRNVDLDTRVSITKQGKWTAYSFDEFARLFCQDDTDIYENTTSDKLYVLIDTAVGHMVHILDSIPVAKGIAESKNHTLVIMYGNIANPKTIEWYCKMGVDYARCSIGRGTCCITSTQTAVGYGSASLIEDIYKCRDSICKQYDIEEQIPNKELHKYKYFTKTKIIADGGIRNFSDAIVALGLGADYVMIGSTFASCFESCADFISVVPDKNKGMLVAKYDKCVFNDKTFTFGIPANLSSAIEEYRELIKKCDLPEITMPRTDTSYILPDKICITTLSAKDIVSEDVKRWLIKYVTLKKSAHGMSTKEAQIDGIKSRGGEIDKSKLKTSEGKTITVDVKYTVHQWVENFTSYLKSAMSYTNCRTLGDFIGNITFVLKSVGTMNSVNK